MSKEYNLTYYCRETGEAVMARIAGDKIEFLVNGTPIKLSVHNARKVYRASKYNKAAKNKPHYQRPKLARRNGFENYLNESNEKLVSGFY